MRRPRPTPAIVATHPRSRMRASQPVARTFALAILVSGCGDSRADRGDAADFRVRLAAQVYSEGETAGFLNILPEGEPLAEWSARDVTVTSDAPLDLSVVAALLSANPQSPASHLTLRLREKHIPSAHVPGIYESSELAAHDGQLVHLVASRNEVVIESIELSQAEALWAQRRPDLPQLQARLSVDEWVSFAGIGAGDADAYGTKAANLAEIHHVLPSEHRPDGFAIPFSAYADFVQQAGLNQVIVDVLDDERNEGDAGRRRQALEALRGAIREASLPTATLERLVEAAEAEFGPDATRLRLRFRSSTNAEDLVAFSGAGLYDSYSGCLADDLDDDDDGSSHCLDDATRSILEGQLKSWQARRAAEPSLAFIDPLIADIEAELSEEKSAARAIKKVWASLWNERAYDERAFYGIEHTRAFMGVAVVRSEKGEQIEAVSISNFLPTRNFNLNRLVSQVGEVGVVRPIDPTAQAEELRYQRGEDDEITGAWVANHSSLLPEGQQIWNDEQLKQLAGLLFTLQDHFGARVYPELDPLALDVEIKVTADGRLLLKQARPYLSNVEFLPAD